MLTDACQRAIQYLRLSVIESCPMRCLYCRPDSMLIPGRDHYLTPEEIEILVRHLVERHGLRKIRLTGGEPTARRDLLQIIERLARIDGLREIAMTTNGLTLLRHAKPLSDTGLNRINVSLDSLDRERFLRMTGVDGVERVIAGLDAATTAGLGPVKLNTVVVRGANDGDLPELVEFAVDRSHDLRFIELMPMGPLADTWAARYVPASEMRGALDGVVADWTPTRRGSSAAETYDIRLRDGRRGRVGFITPMSCSFCDNCNRIRIGADGTLYPCLMDEPAGAVTDALRPRYDAARLDERLRVSLATKAPEHPAVGVGVMTRIGG